MNLPAFDRFCASLPATTTVVQWGDAHVWKVGGKVFALGRDEAGTLAVTFKVSPIGYEILSEQPGLRPAPYLASRGLKWIQHYGKPGLSDRELKAHIRAAHQMIADALPKKTLIALGLG